MLISLIVNGFRVRCNCWSKLNCLRFLCVWFFIFYLRKTEAKPFFQTNIYLMRRRMGNQKNAHAKQLSTKLEIWIDKTRMTAIRKNVWMRFARVSRLFVSSWCKKERIKERKRRSYISNLWTTNNLRFLTLCRYCLIGNHVIRHDTEYTKKILCKRIEKQNKEEICCVSRRRQKCFEIVRNKIIEDVNRLFPKAFSFVSMQWKRTPCATFLWWFGCLFFYSSISLSYRIK